MNIKPLCHRAISKSFTWRPISGTPITVTVDDGVVKSIADPVVLGTVFETPGRGWHFARHGVIETRGSQLCDRNVAVSALLWCLRQEGKV